MVTTYDGTDKCPTAQLEGVVEGDTVTPKVTGASTAVGKHTADVTKLTGKDASNYDLPEDTSVKFEIVKATIPDKNDENNGAAVTITGWTYGDTPNQPAVEGNADGANVTYEYKLADAEDDTYTTKVPTEAGAYTVKATIAATAGYNEKQVTADFEITPKTADISWSDTSLKYTGEAQGPKAEIINLVYGDKVETVLNYKKATEEDTAYTATAPSDAGEYTAKVIKLSGTAAGNYVLPETVTAGFNISKGKLVPTVNISGWTYAGIAGEPVNQPVVEGIAATDKVTYTYAKSGTEEYGTYEEVVNGKAGNYTVKAIIEASGNYDGAEVTADFTIEKKTATLTWESISFTYDAESHIPTATVAEPASGDNALEVTVTDAKTNAGEYMVSATAITGTNSENYVLPTAAAQTFVITKKPISLKWTLGEQEWPNEGNKELTTKYTGADQCPTAAVLGLANADEGKVTAKVTGATTSVGKHTAEVIRLLGTAADNYSLPADPEVSFTIEKADLDNAEIILEDWTYDDSPNVPVVEGNTEGGYVTYMYKAKGAEEGAFTSTVPTLAGEYTVKAIVSATAGYNGKVLTKDFKINKAPLDLVLTISGWTYGDTLGVPQLTGNTGNGDVTFTYYIDSECANVTTNANSGASADGAVPVNAGTYYLKAKVEEVDNYQAGEVTEEFTIAKRTLIVVAANQTKVYGEDDPELTYTYEGLLDGDEITGALARAEGNDVGTYSISQGTLTAGDNYNISFTGAVLTITKADAAVTTPPEANDITYDENAHALLTEGTVSGGTMKYALGSDDTTEPEAANYGDGVPEETNVDTYYVWYKVEGDSNHNDVSAECITVDIKEVAKNELNKAIDASEELLKTMGESEDYSEIAEGLSNSIDAAKGVAGNKNVTQQQVADATQAIKNATNSAVEEKLNVDKANFEEAKEEAKKDADSKAEAKDSEASKKLIADAKNALDNLSYDETKTPEENQEAIDAILDDLSDKLAVQRESDKKAAEDAAAANKVTEMISALPIGKDVKTSDKNAIEAARTAYDALTADQKKLVAAETVKKLENDEAALAAAEKKAAEEAAAKKAAEEAAAKKAAEEAAAKKAAEEAAAKKAAEEAAAKKAAEEAAAKKAAEEAAAKKAAEEAAAKKAAEEAAAKKAAEEAAAKKAAEEAAAKKAAEEAAAKKAAEDAAAANKVTEMINALPASEDVTTKDKDAIEAARKAYNELTEVQKKLITDETVKKLEDVESALAAKEDNDYSNEWVDGQWYYADGSDTYVPKGQWKKNDIGWWYEDESGWYPTSCWQKIDGKWYYFESDGYMDYNEYRDGFWLRSDGSWDETYYGGNWNLDENGWWYKDNTGWYPVNQWLWINYKCYYFDSNGYVLTNQYVNGYWVGEDGSWQ